MSASNATRHNTHSSSACAFYGLQPVLVPYGLSTEELTQRLREVQPDTLIAEAGTLELEPVMSCCENLSHIIWVTKAGNEHMDFAEAPDDVQGEVNISTWHDLIEEHKSPASSELPVVEKGSSSPSLSIVESSGDATTVLNYASEASCSP